MRVVEAVFGKLNDRDVKSYTVITDQGMEFECIDFGCTITKIKVPDRNGSVENVVLGLDTMEEYVNYSPYFGCVIGRNAGRIGKALFEIDGNSYDLTKNDGENNLHSGLNGFHHVLWDSAVEVCDHEVRITFSYRSPDGEEGFPGNLQVEVEYTVTDNHELWIRYRAVSDKKTIVNLTNHSYFNLSGNLKRTILNHELTLKSDGFLELDSTLIPTGKIVSVEGTAFDFKAGQIIGQGIELGHPQIELVGGGYDHPFLLSAQNQREITLIDRESGRLLEVETDEPAVVFYTGNMLGEDFSIRGRRSTKHLGLCLETQKPPNMIDYPGFPSLLLEKDQLYTSSTKYRFATL